MFDEGQHLPSPYHRTKYESEKIVRTEATVPWRVYRPAIVVGDSQTGAMDKVDGPYYFFPVLKRLRDNLPAWLPLVGVDLGDTNVVPVDYVAKAMDHLAHLPDRDGEAFHLVNPEPQSTVEMINTFCSAAGAPRFATPIDRNMTAGPMAMLPRRLRPSSIVNGLMKVGPVQALLDQTIGRLGIPAEVLAHTGFRPVFDSRITEKALAGSGIAVPDLESYARTLWGYWEENLDTSTGRDSKIRAALKGKHVVITGASSGIGQVTALKVAQAGGIPVLVARGKDKLEETKSTIEMRGGTAYVFPCDLSDLEAIDRLCEQITTELPTVDFVINNAGRSIRRSLRLSTDRFHDFERTMQLNYFGAIRLIMGLMPAMQKQKSGHIVNISSIGVQTNPPRFSAYVASKSALDSWSNVVASEVIGNGISFTNIHMPLVRTPMIAPDQDLRQVPDDLTCPGGRHRDQGDGRAPARDQHDARQRRRDRPHGRAQGGVPGAQHGLPRVPGLGRGQGPGARGRDPGERADHACQGLPGRPLVTRHKLCDGSASTGRSGSVIQPLKLPGYSAARTPATSIAMMSWTAVTPEPQYAATSAPATAPTAA